MTQNKHQGILLEVREALTHACADSTGEEFGRYRRVLDQLEAFTADVLDGLGKDIKHMEGVNGGKKLSRGWRVAKLLVTATTEKPNDE